MTWIIVQTGSIINLDAFDSIHIEGDSIYVSRYSFESKIKLPIVHCTSPAERDECLERLMFYLMGDKVDREEYDFRGVPEPPPEARKVIVVPAAPQRLS